MNVNFAHQDLKTVCLAIPLAQFVSDAEMDSM